MPDVKIFQVDFSGDFKKQITRLTRKKKFYSLPDQIDEIIENFEKGNFTGGRRATGSNSLTKPPITTGTTVCGS